MHSQFLKGQFWIKIQFPKNKFSVNQSNLGLALSNIFYVFMFMACQCGYDAGKLMWSWLKFLTRETECWLDTCRLQSEHSWKSQYHNMVSAAFMLAPKIANKTNIHLNCFPYNNLFENLPDQCGNYYYQDHPRPGFLSTINGLWCLSWTLWPHQRQWYQ